MPVSGSASLRRSENEEVINTNIPNATTAAIETGSLNTAALYVVGASGVHNLHVLTIEVSPDNVNWFDSGISVLGIGYAVNTVVGKFIRATVTTVEGVASTCTIYLFAS